MQDEIRAAQAFLLQSQRADGSWPYYLHSDQGFPEPTCYGLLALRGVNDAAQQRALAWLEARANDQGALVLEGDDEPHWTTSHLAWTLTRLGVREELRQRALAWLQTWKAVTVSGDPDGAVDLDPSLTGWPWIGGTFSWVEPTSYALLALKLAGVREHPRIQEAEAMLYDRVCVGGGWNVGNPRVWGTAIEAFLPTTAWALLALQDTPRDGMIERGLALLRDDENKAHSTLSLSLAMLCMDVYGLSLAPLREMLLQRQQQDGSWQGMTQLTALALLALQSAAGEGNVFKIS